MVDSGSLIIVPRMAGSRRQGVIGEAASKGPPFDSERPLVVAILPAEHGLGSARSAPWSVSAL